MNYTINNIKSVNDENKMNNKYNRLINKKYDTKIINSKCICEKYLYYYEEELFALLPCEHIIHFRCIKKIIDTKCPYCNIKLKYILSYEKVKKLKKNPFFFQLYVDMYALKNNKSKVQLKYGNLAFNILPVWINLFNITSIRNTKDLDCIVNNLINLCNIEFNIIDKFNVLKQNIDKRVIISNHISILDPLVIYKMFKCGFLSSSVIEEIPFINDIVEYLPILLIKRGHKNSNVKKINKYIKNNKSLCIFPEGVIHNNNTLINFRSGAFNTNYPILPIIIKYEPYILSYNFTTFLLKAFSQDKLVVNVTVMKYEYPPFSKQKKENIRILMAKTGNLALSRISNRDIKD